MKLIIEGLKKNFEKKEVLKEIVNNFIIYPQIKIVGNLWIKMKLMY